jgi:tetratricopeptide (TPR) repeat protein
LLSEAEGLLDEFRRVADDSGSRYYQAVGMGLQGQLLMALRAPDRAQEAFSAALAVHEPAGSRLQAALIRIKRAEARRASGLLQAAIEDAEAALQLFDRCGAQGYRRQASALLEAWQ